MFTDDYEWYDRLQDDGCPNCPEHLDVVFVEYVSLKDWWTSVDKMIWDLVRDRLKTWADIVITRNSPDA